MKDIESEIAAAYRLLPRTVCKRCGSCCSLWAGMYYVEYLHLSRVISDTWRSSSLNDFKQRIRRNYRYRSASLELQNRMPIRISSGHCIFFNATDNSCNIYENRPLHCRIYGVRGECSNIQTIERPQDENETSRLITEATAELIRLNETYSEPIHHRIIHVWEVRPVEFWFSLYEIAWDPTMDQTDPRYLRNFLRKRENTSRITN